MNGFYQDIPRLYSAIAECMACYVSILLFPRRRSTPAIVVASVIFLATQSALLQATDDIQLYLWLPVMLVAILCMFLYLKVCCRMSVVFTGYVTAAAFLQAELAASLEWQLYCWLSVMVRVPPVAEALLLLGTYSAAFTTFYFLSKNSLRDLDYRINWKELVYVVTITALAFAFSNLSFITHTLPFTSTYRQEIFTIRTLTDLLGLAILYSYQSRLAEVKLKTELDTIQQVLDSQYQTFLNYKESIEVINIKYHDLKHQVQALRTEADPAKREQWIDSMEKELELYNINFDTGNKVLDTILATKELQCKKYGITITFLADGRPLRFMADSDVVSLFANALDNAIEAVVKIPSQEERLIHLEVSEKRSFVFIQCENSCAQGVTFKNGEAQTTKHNKAEHGFGIKSIKYTVKKYRGNVVLTSNNNWFQMNILIPLP